jgi:hypothetical protein
MGPEENVSVRSLEIGDGLFFLAQSGVDTNPAWTIANW